MTSSRSGVLGADGTIDLTGGVAPNAPERPSERPSQRPTARPSGDAWLIDHERRTLRPPPAGPPRPDPEDPEAQGDDAPDDIHREIADRFALGDYAAALSAAELQLGVDATDESARQYAAVSRERLQTRYTTRIGSLDYVFNLDVPAAKVKWLGLDPQASFLLSLVDGQTTVEEVLATCEMDRLEALRVFTELLEAKAIVRVA